LRERLRSGRPGPSPRSSWRREVTLGAASGARGKPRERGDGSLGSAGYPVVPRGFRRKLLDQACVTSPRKRKRRRCGRGSIARGRARASLCVAEVGGRCSGPEKRYHGSFLTKSRDGAAGGLAWSYVEATPKGVAKGGGARKSIESRIVVAKPRDRGRTKSVARRRKRRRVTRDDVPHRGKASRIVEGALSSRRRAGAGLGGPGRSGACESANASRMGRRQRCQRHGPSSATWSENLPRPKQKAKDPPKRIERRETLGSPVGMRATS